jgi:hypothetical protein
MTPVQRRRVRRMRKGGLTYKNTTHDICIPTPKLARQRGPQ